MRVGRGCAIPLPTPWLPAASDCRGFQPYGTLRPRTNGGQMRVAWVVQVLPVELRPKTGGNASRQVPGRTCRPRRLAAAASGRTAGRLRTVLRVLLTGFRNPDAVAARGRDTFASRTARGGRGRTAADRGSEWVPIRVPDAVAARRSPPSLPRRTARRGRERTAGKTCAVFVAIPTAFRHAGASTEASLARRRRTHSPFWSATWPGRRTTTDIPTSGGRDFRRTMVYFAAKTRQPTIGFGRKDTWPSVVDL